MSDDPAPDTASLRPRRLAPALAALVAALAIALALGLSVGAADVPIGDVISALLGREGPPESHVSIVIDLRLPRTLLMALTGAALAAAGAALQGLFRNPLADPYIVGVASGAGLGATLIISTLAPATALGLFAVPAGAFAGGILSVGLVVIIAQVGRSTPVTTLLLAGVAVSSLATAVTTFWMLRSPAGLNRAFNWLLGGYAGGGWTPIGIILPYLGVGLVGLQSSARALNALQFDEEQARQLGVDVDALKLRVLALATLMTAAAVSFGGLLGFVGLVVPHVTRMLAGPDHRRLLPLSALGGAAFLILADVVARTVFAPQELPVGVITALIGAPFFIFLLRRLKRAVF